MTDLTPTDEQQAILRGADTGNHLAITAGAGTGKALRDDQNVMTPDGPRPIGTLQVGDLVIGSSGGPTAVTGVFPQGVRPLHEVVTSDGVTIVADAEHRWEVGILDVSARPEAGRPSAIRNILTTEEIKSALDVGSTVCVPLLRNPAEFRAAAGVRATGGGTTVATGPTWDSVSRRKDSLDRVLAQGTGGFVTVPTDEASTVAQIARSLGAVADIRNSKTSGRAVVHVTFPENDSDRRRLRRIISVTPAAPGSATCISVDAPDHLYATEGFVLTHNTSTVKMAVRQLLEDEPTAGALYIAFNKSIATEMQGALDEQHFHASTIHSLAWRSLMRRSETKALLDRVLAGNGIPPWEVPRHLGVKHSLVYKVDVTSRPGHDYHGDDWVPGPSVDDGVSVSLDPDQLCTMAEKAITKWCHSSRTAMSSRDVQRRSGMSEEDHNKVLVPLVLELAQRMWDTDLTRPDGKLKYTHDYYLKLWALQHPSLMDEFMPWASRGVLFFDESQDANPVIAGIITEQLDSMQVVSVGDSRQAIYGFRGVIDYLSDMEKLPGVLSFPLTKSWRFGVEIAELANLVLELLPGDFQVVGNDAIPSIIVPVPHGALRPDATAIITRSNREMLTELLTEIERGRKVFCQANTGEIIRICKDVANLRVGKKAFHQDMKFFRSLAELETYLKDPSTESTQFVGLARTVLSVGEDTVTRAIKGCVDAEEDADVVISTIHKAKGREWDSVRIVGDPDKMLPLGPDSEFPATKGLREALMLLYVAITRAKSALFIDEALHEKLVSTVNLVRS